MNELPIRQKTKVTGLMGSELSHLAFTSTCETVIVHDGDDGGG